MTSLQLEPSLVWGIFTRLLGVLYLLSFGSFLLDASGWVGMRGVQPVAPRLTRIRTDFPSWRRFVWFPTLLWFGASDRRIKTLLIVGLVAAGMVVFGVASQPALLVCWAILLSFDIAYDMAYPWECALFEAGFLALFLPALAPLPALSAIATPLPVIAWAYRLLLFRVLFGFGKTKFTPKSLEDMDYLRSFFIAQPLPTPLAWWGVRAPRIALRASLFMMFLVEIILPFFIFVRGDARLVVAAAVTLLMLGIQLTGNYGYFNVLMIALCVPLLDTQAALSDQFQGETAPTVFGIVAGLVVLVHTLGALLNAPANNWIARGWLYWVNWREVRVPGLQRFVAFYRALTPFRLVHAYGIFPPKIGPCLRYVPSIECTADGETWHHWPTRYIATGTHEPPRFFAPRFPRIDHTLFYEAALLQYTNEYAPLVSPGFPYGYSTVTSMHRIAQRLLEPNSPVARMLGSCPIDVLPTAVRVRSYACIPTTPAQRAETGAWWRLYPAGFSVPATGVNPAIFEYTLPAPARFAWDEQEWRDRAPALAEVQRGVAPSGSAVDSFWTDYLPIAVRARTDWSALRETRGALEAAFTVDERIAHESTARLLCAALGARLEPYFLNRKSPRLVLPSWYHVGMLAQQIVGSGRAHYQAALDDLTLALAQAPHLQLESGLLFDVLARFDVFAWHVRFVRRTERAWDEPMPAPPPGIPGFPIVLAELAQRFPLPADDECAPLAFRRDAKGWTLIDSQCSSAE